MNLDKFYIHIGVELFLVIILIYLLFSRTNILRKQVDVVTNHVEQQQLQINGIAQLIQGNNGDRVGQKCRNNTHSDQYQIQIAHQILT